MGAAIWGAGAAPRGLLIAFAVPTTTAVLPAVRAALPIRLGRPERLPSMVFPFHLLQPFGPLVLRGLPDWQRRMDYRASPASSISDSRAASTTSWGMRSDIKS